MFLPHDLTTSERGLVDTVTRQLLAHRRPTGDEQERAVRHEAAQIAAEMIFEARAAQHAQATSEEPSGPGGPDKPDEEIPDTGYHRRLMRMAEIDRRIRERQMAERDQATTESAGDA